MKIQEKQVKSGKHLWKNGESGNPNGRPRGSRTIAIEIIYRVFNNFGQQKFETEMKELVQKNPVAFYLKFIQPIQPKEIDLGNIDENPLRIVIEDAKTS